MAITAFKGKYRFLSNFYDAPFSYELAAWPTSEHAYQAAKTFDKDQKTSIQLCATPGAAKRLGKMVTRRSDWEEIKVRVMGEILKAKFDQNDYLKRQLTATGTEDLVEGNTWGDVFWGMCKGEGQNNLGKLLMDLRDFYLETEE